MSMLTPWRPYHSPHSYSLMNDLFRDLLAGPGLQAQPRRWAPRVNLSESEEKYSLEVELPGLEPEDVEITLKGDTLTLKGEKQSESTQEEETFHIVERSYGSFTRSFTFPEPIKANSVEAKAANGLLTVTVKKAGEESPARIEIKS